MDDGVQMMIGSGALGALCGVATAWIKARFSKTRVEPQPLEVAPAPSYRTCAECDRRHAEVEKRLAAGDRAFQELRHDIQSGFQRVTDRISPVAEACAANSAALQVLLKHQPDKLP